MSGQTTKVVNGGKGLIEMVVSLWVNQAVYDTYLVSIFIFLSVFPR